MGKFSPSQTISDDIFRAYDIRGEYGTELTEENAYLIGQAIGTTLQANKQPDIICGRDGRLSSPNLADALMQGLQSTGCRIIDLGTVPTPVVYFAIQQLDIPNAVMVTGSHNPAQYNGIKIVIDRHCQHTHQIKAIYTRILNKQFYTGTGTIEKHSILDTYIDQVVQDISLERPLSIGIDCSNGAASLIAETLFTKLGCNTHMLYDVLDGHFPNHSPDPTAPENLQALQHLVEEKQLDLGIAFDGDADRVIAVYADQETSHILWPDRILMILAKDILQSSPNALCLYDVKCSNLLNQYIKQYGGKTEMVTSGHSLLKARMEETNAILGGEFSGHIILADRNRHQFYADDATYAAVRLLEVLAKTDSPSHELIDSLPKNISTPETKKYFLSPKDAQATMQRYTQKLRQLPELSQAKIHEMDGFRADFKDCWGLARCSNTSSSITFRFEAESPEKLAFIEKLFTDAFQSVKPLGDSVKN
jgi:phosphomannomutase/phosphoglucomutase